MMVDFHEARMGPRDYRFTLITAIAEKRHPVVLQPGRETVLIYHHRNRWQYCCQIVPEHRSEYFHAPRIDHRAQKICTGKLFPRGKGHCSQRIFCDERDIESEAKPFGSGHSNAKPG